MKNESVEAQENAIISLSLGGAAAVLYTVLWHNFTLHKIFCKIQIL